MAGETLIDLRNIRLAKAQKLRDLGIDPYPSKANKEFANQFILDHYEQFVDKKVTLAGRLMSWREHGHLVFGHIQDQTGRIQVYIKDSEIHQTDKDLQLIGFSDLNLVDVGDIIEVTGIITRTQRGEISILAQQLRMLTKAIRPLPDQWSGLNDKETRFRQRYLTTIINPQERVRFEKFAQITFAIREFLYSKGYLEIKTPIIQPVYGGGLAKPFKTHVNALDVDYYLAISHELYLKRLITAGFDNVFNLNGYFRNEGIDRTHNPEFTMLETMSAFHNYEYNMDLTEEMYRYIATKVFNTTVFTINGQDVDFGKPWKRIMMKDAVKEYTKIDFDTITTIEEAREVLTAAGLEPAPTIGECLKVVFEEKVEEHLIQPTFIYGHPVEISPLAKQMSSDKRYVERFEIFIGGIEGGDNWTELNDPVELFNRFKEQVQKGRGGDEEAHPMDIEFVEMMEYGMPPTTGLGPGIERLTMMLTGTEYIDDVLFFPMLRPAPITDLQKQIYGSENIGVAVSPTANTSEPKFDLAVVPDMDLVIITDDVKAKYKGLKTGYLVVENVSVSKSNADLEALKREIISQVKATYSDASAIKNTDNIKGFREIYKSFGVDPNSKLNSAESLLRRVVSDKGLYNINTVVDTYNICSIQFALPMAAYDLDNVKGKISLRFANDGEKMTKILETEPTQVGVGELVYADEEGITCIDLNYRDADRTKVTEETKRLLVFVDGHSLVSEELITEALSVLASRLQKFTGGKVIGKGLMK